MNPVPDDLGTPGLPAIGAAATFGKTVTEADVTLFAGITGDLAPHHVDAAFMSEHPLGQRVAHGVLTLGIASTASSALCANESVRTVSAGYDNLRFLAPVFLGDTVTARVEVDRLLPERRLAIAQVEVTNQRGERVLVAEHRLYCFDEGDR